MSNRLTPEDLELYRQYSTIKGNPAWASVKCLVDEIDALRRDLAESERLRKEAELTIQVSSKPMKLIQEQIATLEAEKSKLTEGRDNQYEYNAGLIERYATLEQEKVALVEALQPFADAEKDWMDGGPRAEIRMDWLTKAREALSSDSSQRALDRLKKLDALREAATDLSRWLQSCGGDAVYVDIAMFNRRCNKLHEAVAASQAVFSK